MTYCEKLTSLVGIAHSMALQRLDAIECHNLKDLTLVDFISLKQLQFLDVSYCKSLMSLVGISHATALKHVDKLEGATK